MTYRLLLWFDMLEEEGKSTERVRGLFSRMPLLSKDLSKKRSYGGGYSSSRGNGYGCSYATIDGNGYGDGYTTSGDGSGLNSSDGGGNGNSKDGHILMVKI